jgi:hypothetical protein
VKIVFVRQSYDELTKILNAWAKRAKPTCSIAMDLDGFAVTEGNLRACLNTQPDAELVAFYGHGTQESLVVQGKTKSDIPLIQVSGPGVSPKELAGRNLYAVACNAGARLGPALAAAGCHFVGYKRKFFVVPQFEEEFGNVVNRSLISWAVEGKTRSEIRKQLRREWLQLADSLEDKNLPDPNKQRYLFIAAAFASRNGGGVVSY